MSDKSGPDGDSQQTPSDDKTSYQNFPPFIEGLTDAVGLIAFAHFVLSCKDKTLSDQVTKQLQSANRHDVDVFRSAAKECIEGFTARQITASVESVKSQIAYEAYSSIMRTNFDYLLKEQENKFNQIISDLEDSSNVFRQLWIAVAASFVFGLVITAAQFIPNPLNVHWVVSTSSSETGVPKNAPRP